MQVSLDFTVEEQKLLPFDSPRARRITILITEMIAVASIVNDLGFVCLLNHLETCFNFPSRKYFLD